MSTLLVCECGCGQSAHINRMKWVLAQELDDGLQRVSKRWLVLGDCKKAFERELQCVVALEMLVTTYARRIWLVRIWTAHRVYNLQVAIHSRNKGPEKARQFARRTALEFGLPERWGHWLAARWERKTLAEQKTKEENT